ncbi:MAG TPA: DUF885 domain-containing protein [Acidimicrobiia bacterium]|nr:DUF885 domain-containing protein [Acidimicrobiia bacterium]
MPGSERRAVYEIADRYVEQYAALDPCGATYLGVAGHDHEMTDFSPDATAERVQLARDTIAELERAPKDDDNDRLAAAVQRDRLQRDVDFFDAQEDLRPLRIIGSPVQEVRQCFDLMSYETDDDWATVVTRMRRVPDALTSIEATLREGVARGVVSARRQALACAQQAEAWGGSAPYFKNLAERRPDDRELEAAAEDATASYARFGAYLRDEYAPKADPRDPVGRDRYKLFSGAFNGVDLDFDETYAWGIEELHRIEHQMQVVGERILPGESVTRVIEHLDADPTRSIEGVDEFRRWNQDLIDRTIAELNGVHFDIAEPLQRCEAMIAPPGGAAAMYYTGPSEDFSRPGRTWYPTLGATRFPLWKEVSTCYHEAVPGHHLQVGQVKYLAGKLSRFQRLMSFVSGHGEGWALYAERLMGELGYLDDPAWEMGMLAAQAMRAVRVVVDIGMHLELPIPAHERYHPGETWTPELALPFVIERSRFPEQFMRSEVDRYLGWPAQAISYKVGERVWLECREDARRRKGAGFDLKAFHTYALDLGGMGLGLLREELARF